jgi:hypothetical protein
VRVTARAVSILTCAVLAFAAAPGAGPAAAAGPLLPKPYFPPQPVSACGTLAGAGNTYFLTTNLGPVGTNCLVVTAPHVTLNLEGYTITGDWTLITTPHLLSPSEIGILIKPKAVGTKVESTVAGAAVDNFTYGILDQANRAVITGPDLLVNNAVAGVSLHDVAGGIVRRLGINDIGVGIRLQHSSGASIRANMIGTARIYGIWDEASTSAQITDNDIDASGIAGIYLGCSDSANLQDVGCAGPSSGSGIQHNNLLDNGDYGIVIADESLDNSVEDNTVAGDKTYDLADENTGCDGGVTPPGNSWTDNTGTANQSTSSSCIG